MSFPTRPRHAGRPGDPDHVAGVPRSRVAGQARPDRVCACTSEVPRNVGTVGEQATLGELAKARRPTCGSTAGTPRAVRERRAGLAAGAPFAAVFLVFFLVPLALTVMVSFWDYNEYQIIPAFTSRNYAEIFDGCLDKLRRALRHASRPTSRR